MSLMGQYEYIINHTHPRSNNEGQVYLHIIIAEHKLGRALLPEEVVHHKDLNKLNNSPDNLMIFATKGDHTRFHMNDCNEDLLLLNSDGSYICLSHKSTCADCGAEISRWATRCRQCASELNRKAERPTSNELFNILINYKGNFTRVAKQYGVTDNAIRKWCDLYGLPRKSQDYKQFN